MNKAIAKPSLVADLIGNGANQMMLLHTFFCILSFLSRGALFATTTQYSTVGRLEEARMSAGFVFISVKKKDG